MEAGASFFTPADYPPFSARDGSSKRFRSTLYDYALSEDDILYAPNDGEIFVPPDTSSNLSYDDIIDFKDFAAFALQWLDSCPEQVSARRTLTLCVPSPQG
ncbi:MAG: hypothetical protein ACYS9T_03000 [Planctomycetota bacterium]